MSNTHGEKGFTFTSHNRPPNGDIIYRLMVNKKRVIFLIGLGLRVLRNNGFHIFAVMFRGKLQRAAKIRLSQFVPWIHKTSLPHSNKPDIICFPVIDWDFRFQRPQQILTQFAHAGYRVFYFSTRFSGSGQNEIHTSPIAKQILSLSLPGANNIDLYQDLLTGENLAKAHHALFNFICKHNLVEAVCLVQHPFWTPLARILKESFGWKIVYDCLDDHSAFQNMNINIGELENEIITACDLVVTTSDLLYQKLCLKHPNCVLVPNAVNYEHFSPKPTSEENFLFNFPHPVIGYYGAIAEWFDIASIFHAALSHPEWSFVLIGHTFGAEIQDLSKLSNVHFLGEMPYSKLPGYLVGFDVCTIPFLRTPLTEATNPVKVYEYLSSGKPIVARNLPELEAFSDLVCLYNTPDEFVSQLERAVLDDRANDIERRQAVARQNTWQMRYQSLKSSIDGLYEKTSIVIVTWNNLEFTKKCIQSILADQTWPSYEIIIVDNASTDGTVEYLMMLSAQESRVRAFYNNKNLGFGAATNIGLGYILDSKFVVLLNNDTIVPHGWLARLLRHARRPKIGMVGPVTNFAGNEARIDVPYTDIRDMDAFALSYSAKHDGMTFDIRMLAMYCVAMSKEVFDKIGPLDERFGIGMFEDDDYSRRVRQAGYRIICAEDVYVHHYGRASIDKLTEHDYWNLFERNRRLYEDKWKEAWLPHKYRGE